MSLSIVELSKAVKSLDEAIQLYSKSIKGSQEQTAFRDACIQRFEYCIELSWKTSMKALGSTTAAAKPAVREMARNNLVTDSAQWLEFIEARNNTSHSYDEDIAKKVLAQILTFLPHAQALQAELSKIIK